MSMYETGRAEMPTPSPEESAQDQAADRALEAEEGVEEAKADSGAEKLKARFEALEQWGLDALAAHEKLVAEAKDTQELDATISETAAKMRELLASMKTLEGNDALPATSKAEAIDELNRDMSESAFRFVDAMMVRNPDLDESRVKALIADELKESLDIAERAGNAGVMRMYEAKMQDHALASKIAELEDDKAAMESERQALNGMLEPYAELYMKQHPEATEDQAMDAAIEESGLKDVTEDKIDRIDPEGFKNLRGRARIGRAKLRAASQQAGRASGGGFSVKV